MKKKDKSEGIFRQFWTEIIDLKSAKKAANAGAVSPTIAVVVNRTLFMFFPHI